MSPYRTRMFKGGRSFIFYDLWMFIVTALVALALLANSDNTDEIRRERNNNIIRTCREANDRHTKAFPGLIPLVQAQPIPDDPQHIQARKEVINALIKNEGPPHGIIAIDQWRQVVQFIEIIAPRYNCQERVKLYGRQ